MTDENKNELQEDLLEDQADSLFGSDDDEITNEQEETISDEPKEEVKAEAPETKIAAPTTQAPELEQAKKNGYLTEEQYKAKHGTLDGFKSPEQFNKYGQAWTEVSDVIKNMQKQLSERDKQIDSLVKYNERVEERAAQRAREELEAQIAQAKTAGDVQAVEELTREKAKQEFHTYHSIAQELERERSSVLQNFMERNKHWYGINQQMTARAAQIDAEEVAKAQSAGVKLNYAQLANVVETRMRLEFPDTMISTNTGNTAPNISSTQSTVNKSTTTMSDSSERMFSKLGSDQQAIFNATNRALKRMGKREYSKKEFIEKLKREGEI